MKKLVIIGASGHGKVVADIARLNEYKQIVFLDDSKVSGKCSDYEIVGDSKSIDKFDCDFFVAIGNAQIRDKIFDVLKKKDKNIVTLIHPDAVIGENVYIGMGSVVMAGAVINPCTKIGEGCIVNTCSSVDHDGLIGDFVHIAVGAHLCGTVFVGDKTWIGAGATVSNNIEICAECTIGAGAVVVKNIEEKGTYIGVPARKR